jgi:TatA/E family protein of Tat protein translocase
MDALPLRIGPSKTGYELRGILFLSRPPVNGEARRKLTPGVLPATPNQPPIAANPQRQYDECMNLGFPEMIFLFFLALIIFGPKKLPEIGRQIGRAINEFKRASNEFRSQIEAEISNLETETRQILPPAQSVAGTIAARATPSEAMLVQAPETPPQLTGTPEPDSVGKVPNA